MKKEKTSQFFSNNSQLLIPLIAILLLVIFNLFRDPSFFSVGIAANNNGDPVLLFLLAFHFYFAFCKLQRPLQ